MGNTRTNWFEKIQMVWIAQPKGVISPRLEQKASTSLAITSCATAGDAFFFGESCWFVFRYSSRLMLKSVHLQTPKSRINWVFFSHVQLIQKNDCLLVLNMFCPTYFLGFDVDIQQPYFFKWPNKQSKETTKTGGSGPQKKRAPKQTLRSGLVGAWRLHAWATHPGDGHAAAGGSQVPWAFTKPCRVALGMFWLKKWEKHVFWVENLLMLAWFVGTGRLNLRSETAKSGHCCNGIHMSKTEYRFIIGIYEL